MVPLVLACCISVVVFGCSQPATCHTVSGRIIAIEPSGMNVDTVYFGDGSTIDVLNMPHVQLGNEYNLVLSKNDSTAYYFMSVSLVGQE